VEVEAKSGQHHGTYKVSVNFIPVADISFIPKELFNAIKKESIRVAGILYAPPNLLRMGMYLELSRPDGDVSRWEKVLKRLTLLNRNYPLSAHNCSEIDFQRKMIKNEKNVNSDEIYETIKTTLIDQGVVFFGGYTLSLYSQYMPNNLKKRLEKVPDFDVLSEEPLLTSQIVKERLADINVKNVKIIQRPAVGEIIAPHYEIRVGSDVVAFIYEPLACHSYNIIKDHGYDIKIATIDTMLSFYLAFLYANRPYYDKNRILCMSKYLFEVQEKNRLEQKGLLKRFSINCMGHQETIEEMRAKKTEKFAELKDKKGTPEYDEWFLRYRPTDNNNSVSLKKEAMNQKPENKNSKNISKNNSKNNTWNNTWNRKTNKKTKRKTKKRKSIFGF
jgi:hypothetical protein